MGKGVAREDVSRVCSVSEGECVGVGVTCRAISLVCCEGEDVGVACEGVP